MTNEIIKKEVREIIENHIDNCINYEWEGIDFNFRVLEQCVDQNEELFKEVVIDTKEPSVQFDNELYQKFIDHVTEFVCSGFSVKKQNDYV